MLRPNRTTFATILLQLYAEKRVQWMYPAYLLTSTTSIAQLSRDWKTKSFSFLMLLDIFISVNNWKILTQKVSYEFLVVIMVWRSDLFSILICSALSSLKVNAGLIKQCWKIWGQNCAWAFLIIMGWKALNEFFFWCWSQLTISSGSILLFTCWDRPQNGKKVVSCWNPFFSFQCACSEVLGTMSGVHPFSILFLTPAQSTYVRKLVVWKHLEKIFVSTQSAELFYALPTLKQVEVCILCL